MDTGLRTSTNAGLAGGIAVLIIWVGGMFAPESMANAPAGLEAAITGIIMALVARFSSTPKNPGKL